MDAGNLLILVGVGAVVVLGLVASALWAVWRMTWAHERIAQRVSEIERLVEEHVRRRVS